MKTVFVNIERCVGCKQCEFACAVAHSRSKDPVQALYEDPLPRKRIHVEPGPVFSTAFPNKCRHCDPAPCMQVCPTAAIYRDREQDLVLIQPAKCIACAMCAMVCPFDVLTYYPLGNGGPARVVAVKCDGCAERVRKGLVPACVETCKVGALLYGDINELVQAGRLREATAVLVAATAVAPPPSPVPQPVALWRSGGTAISKLRSVQER